jgi:hypothetical protein
LISMLSTIGAICGLSSRVIGGATWRPPDWLDCQYG